MKISLDTKYKIGDVVNIKQDLHNMHLAKIASKISIIYIRINVFSEGLNIEYGVRAYIKKSGRNKIIFYDETELTLAGMEN
jgi:hypothetical protein